MCQLSLPVAFWPLHSLMFTQGGVDNTQWTISPCQSWLCYTLYFLLMRLLGKEQYCFHKYQTMAKLHTQIKNWTSVSLAQVSFPLKFPTTNDCWQSNLCSETNTNATLNGVGEYRHCIINISTFVLRRSLLFCHIAFLKILFCGVPW